MNKGINLATNTQKAKGPLFSQLRFLRFSAAGILALVALSSMILFFLIAASPLPGLKKQENGQLFQITQLHPKIAKYLLLNERVSAINKLLMLRDSKSKNLSDLESQLPSQTSVDSLGISDKGIILSASSASLGNINTLIANVLANTGSNKNFSSVVLNSLSYDPKQQNYHITLNITL